MGQSFLQQIQRNAVALISLTVAVSSLGYNTWRNEQTEANRNIRVAGFQLMEHIVELQKVVFFSRYDDGSKQDSRGDYRNGWAHVLSIRDLSYNMPQEVRGATDNLFETWNTAFATIQTDQVSFKKFDKALDETKTIILQAIMELD